MSQRQPRIDRRFPEALAAVVQSLIDDGAYPNKAATAIGLGIGHPRLSRLLTGTTLAGTKTVSTICSKINRAAASDLLLAYLQDEADTVIRAVRKSVTPPPWSAWGPDTLVLVQKAERESTSS
jgi:hypothetical protein